MATSVERVDRIGPTRSASADWNTAASRVSAPSTCSSNTTSAWLRPAWGCAPDSLSTLTTRATRIALLASGCGKPVSGDTTGTDVDVELEVLTTPVVGAA